MMNIRSLLQIGIGGMVAAIGTTSVISSAAAVYEAVNSEQQNFIAVAVPYDQQYNLLVIEQIPGQQQCWSEQSSKPTIVEPLLVNFDFTHSCRRATDSNGYSMRIDNQDYGMEYLLTIVERSNELQLVAIPYDRQSKPIVIGRTNGIAPGLLKIELDSDWQFSRRVYQGKTLGHVYFHNQEQISPHSEEIAFNSPLPVDSIQKIEENNLPNPIDSSSSQSQINSTDVQKEIVFTAPNHNDSAVVTTPDLPNLPPDPALNSLNPSNVPPVSSSNSSNNSPSQSLSDVINLDKPSLNSDNNQLSVSPTPPPSNTTQSSATSVSFKSNSTYRVLVSVANPQQSEKVKLFFPDAFSTVYQGQSVLQIGKFSDRNNADSAVRTLYNLGLSPTILSD